MKLEHDHDFKLFAAHINKAVINAYSEQNEATLERTRKDCFLPGLGEELDGIVRLREPKNLAKAIEEAKMHYEELKLRSTSVKIQKKTCPLFEKKDDFMVSDDDEAPVLLEKTASVKEGCSIDRIFQENTDHSREIGLKNSGYRTASDGRSMLS